MSKVHIGKKIKEIQEKAKIPVVDFAKSINLTRDAVYKIFNKESIDTEQLRKISLVLKHNFFLYYQDKLDHVNEKQLPYGYATKEDVEELTRLVNVLLIEVEKLKSGQLAGKKSSRKKKK